MSNQSRRRPIAAAPVRPWQARKYRTSDSSLGHKAAYRDHRPLLVFTPDQAAARHGLRRRLIRYQAYLLIPLAVWAGLTIQIQAWRHVLGGRRGARVRWESALFAGAYLGWLVLPSLLFGPARWLPLFGLGQLLVGPYMVLIFAPNHKGMPVIRGRRPAFLEQQVLTSRNVRGSPIVDFVFGGQNYQIEHHLFPDLARNRLPECQRIVRAFCLEVGLPYIARYPRKAAARSICHPITAVSPLPQLPWTTAELPC